MKLKVMTCARAQRELGSAPRHYGYTLALNPPLNHVIEGQDVEGIGWVPYCPPLHVVEKWQGWYKYKHLAQRRADALNKSA
jgi:hypothetical protein